MSDRSHSLKARVVRAMTEMTAIEYGLIAALIAVIAIAVLQRPYARPALRHSPAISQPVPAPSTVVLVPLSDRTMGKLKPQAARYRDARFALQKALFDACGNDVNPAACREDSARRLDVASLFR